ncbi:hypothetical protein [Coleofasciculus sp. FACHB-129]|uniref:hypothetical protein n=1 Tax=Cyanophyceae TaxID=3028117 RepID=UPI00168286F3|nr:hypothetical protein [Coleofasciculus sp. FACHB-129]MBD1897031.1 hypothetical protein [Coleofasciculus sp. FACHB-129]
MDFLTCVTCIMLGTHTKLLSDIVGWEAARNVEFLPLSNVVIEGTKPKNYFELGFAIAQTNLRSPLQQSLSRERQIGSNSQRANMTMTIKLLPYEILARTAISYADISLSFTNPSKKNQLIEISKIEIVPAKSEEVLMSATPQELERPAKVVLKPGESKVLEYRLKCKSKIYRRGENAIAHIHYQLNGQTQTVAQSESQAVAFMIP